MGRTTQGTTDDRQGLSGKRTHGQQSIDGTRQKAEYEGAAEKGTQMSKGCCGHVPSCQLADLGWAQPVKACRHNKLPAS